MIEKYCNCDGIFLQHSEQLTRNETKIRNRGFNRRDGVVHAWLKWLVGVDDVKKTPQQAKEDELAGITDIFKTAIDGLKSPGHFFSIVHRSFTCMIGIDDCSSDIKDSMPLLVYGVKFTCDQVSAVADAMVTALETNTSLPSIAFDFVNHESLAVILERRGFVGNNCQTWTKRVKIKKALKEIPEGHFT
jgi:hypothetical protein